MSTVAHFSIAPVGSLGLQHLTEIDETEIGVAEDRRFYLSDDQDRSVDRIVVGRIAQVEATTDASAIDLPLWREPAGDTTVVARARAAAA